MMDIKKNLGILSLALLIFAFMFGVMTPSGFCIGDSVLRSIGLKAWSNESAERAVIGFHNTFLFSLAFAILGYTGAKHNLKNIYPKLVEKLPLIAVILFLSSSLLFNWGYSVVLSFSKGVNAVDYLPEQSSCNYTIGPANNEILYSYQITLRNYSKSMVKFNMQVQKPSNDWINMSDVMTTDVQGQQPLREFILEPEETKEFQFKMKNQDTENSSSFFGSLHRPNIVIFDEKSSREFIVY